MKNIVVNLWKLVDGKKTHLLSIGAIVLASLLQFDVIDQHTYETILALLAPLGVMTLRAALKKTTN